MVSAPALQAFRSELLRVVATAVEALADEYDRAREKITDDPTLFAAMLGKAEGMREAARFCRGLHASEGGRGG